MDSRARGGQSGRMPADNPASLNPTELLRRLENAVRLGTIAQVRHAAPARCRVKTGENTTDWLPWMTQRAGKDRTWWAPEVGEQVLVLSPGGNMGSGVVLPGIYSDSHPQPDDDPDVSCVKFEDGASMEYNRATGELTIDVIRAIVLIVGATRLRLTPSGSVLETPKLTVDSQESTFKGEVIVQGLLSYQSGLSGRTGGGGGNVISGGLAMEGGSVTHDGTNIGSTHSHPGDSGGTTGAPQ